MRLRLTLAMLLCFVCAGVVSAREKVISEDKVLDENTLVCVSADLLETVISLQESGKTINQATNAVWGCLFTKGKTRVRITEERSHYTYTHKYQIMRFEFLDVPGLPPRFGLNTRVEKYDPGV